MHTAAEVVVWACWAAWAALWLAMGFGNKRTATRDAPSSTGVIVVLAALGIVAIRAAGHDLHRRLWTTSPLVGAVAILLLVGGLAFTAWARVALGRNWSGTVVVKEGHELVQSGPYAVVRHPIYTGILAMALGTALVVAEPYGLYVFGLVAVVLWFKSRREEALMARTFPDEYPAYRRRVRAIIPFVL